MKSKAPVQCVHIPLLLLLLVGLLLLLVVVVVGLYGLGLKRNEHSVCGHSWVGLALKNKNMCAVVPGHRYSKHAAAGEITYEFLNKKSVGEEEWGSQRQSVGLVITEASKLGRRHEHTP